MGTQQLCLKWNKHYSNLLDVSEHLLTREAFVDVTLSCEGTTIKAHKLVLSACSPYFQSIFIENPCQHPVVILKGVRYIDLKAVIEFMYRGQVSVSRDQLSALLETAQLLQVRGLAEDDETNRQPPGDGQSHSHGVPNSCHSPSSRRKKRKKRSSSIPSDSNISDSEQGMPLKMEVPVSPDTIHIDESDHESPRGKTCRLSPANPGDSRSEAQNSAQNATQSNPHAEEETPPPSVVITEVPDEIVVKTEKPSENSEEQGECFIGDSTFQLPPSFTSTPAVSSASQLRTSCESHNLGSEHSSRTLSSESHLLRLMTGDSRLTANELTPLRLGPDSQHASSSSAKALGDSHLQRTTTETDSSNMVVPFSVSSESSGASVHDTGSQDAMLINSMTYEDIPGSSMTASSSGQQKDGTDGSGISIGYSILPTGVLAIPGPSGYQPDEQAAKQQGLNQEFEIEPTKSAKLRYLYDEEKGYGCHFCNKYYRQIQNVKDHMLMHMDNGNQYLCNLCSRSFKWGSALSRHKAKVHGRLLKNSFNSFA